MSIMLLRKAFTSDGRRLLQIKVAVYNEKSFIKTIYCNNVTLFISQYSFNLMKFFKDNYKKL